MRHAFFILQGPAARRRQHDIETQIMPRKMRMAHDEIL
jgi:hypothetical protein